jgi:hypothetical protein
MEMESPLDYWLEMTLFVPPALTWSLRTNLPHPGQPNPVTAFVTEIEQGMTQLLHKNPQKSYFGGNDHGTPELDLDLVFRVPGIFDS